jgi:XapX domain-containing protein
MPLVALGLVLGVMIGGLCKLLEIPSPAPSVLTGALLVVAMTSGYAATDRWLVRREPQHRDQCGGPDGSAKSG